MTNSSLADGDATENVRCLVSRRALAAGRRAPRDRLRVRAFGWRAAAAAAVVAVAACPGPAVQAARLAHPRRKRDHLPAQRRRHRRAGHPLPSKEFWLSGKERSWPRPSKSQSAGGRGRSTGVPGADSGGRRPGASSHSRVDLHRGLARPGTRPHRPPDGNASRRAAPHAGTVRELTASNRSRAIGEGPAMEGQNMFLDCPACMDKEGIARGGLPAEVRCTFIMRSTDGPLDAVMIGCPAAARDNAGPVTNVGRRRGPRHPSRAGRAGSPADECGYRPARRAPADRPRPRDTGSALRGGPRHPELALAAATLQRMHPAASRPNSFAPRPPSLTARTGAVPQPAPATQEEPGTTSRHSTLIHNHGAGTLAPG